jgi:hypothetical protein
MIKSGTTVSTPIAGNKECNDIQSHLPTTRPEQCPWPDTQKCTMVIFYPGMEPLMELNVFSMSQAL